MSNLKTWPEKIFLQVGDGISKLPERKDCEGWGITWCEDSVMDCEVEYVRADINRALKQSLLDAKTEVSNLKIQLKNIRKSAAMAEYIVERERDGK